MIFIYPSRASLITAHNALSVMPSIKWVIIMESMMKAKRGDSTNHFCSTDALLCEIQARANKMHARITTWVSLDAGRESDVRFHNIPARARTAQTHLFNKLLLWNVVCYDKGRTSLRENSEREHWKVRTDCMRKFNLKARFPNRINKLHALCDVISHQKAITHVRQGLECKCWEIIIKLH